MLEALSEDSPYRRIVCPKGTQLGFTEIGLIWIGQGILEAQSTLVIQPTEAVAKKVVRTKFRPMLQSTTVLKPVFTGRAADSTLHFSAPSVDVMFAGSNSPTNFATVTVPRFFGDEVDRWSLELEDEGDPIDLADNRIAEYGFLGKMFLPCSPTVQGASVVWREFLDSDQRYFEVPCPACDHFQAWTWDNMVVEGEDEAKMRCVACLHPSAEHEWKAIWGRGVWRATVDAPVRPDSAGFHLSTLYARLGQRTWKQLVAQHRAVVKSGLSSRLQTFVNTILGLPWKLDEDSMDAEELRERLDGGCERGVVPAGGLVLTAGVDYQKNRIEIFIWAWARGRERWLVTKEVVERQDGTGRDRPSGDLAAEVALHTERQWPHALGGALPVEMTLHDANDRPADVFDIIDHLPRSRHIAVNSDDGWGRNPRFEPPRVKDFNRQGKAVKFGRRVIRVHSAEAKRDWYDDLRRPLAEEGHSERYVHIPEWADEEEGLLKQFVAEELTKSKRGRLRWDKKKGHERNEALDCAVLAEGARWQLKTHRWSEAEWRRREGAVAVGSPSAPPPHKPAPDVPRGPGGRRIRGRMR